VRSCHASVSSGALRKLYRHPQAAGRILAVIALTETAVAAKEKEEHAERACDGRSPRRGRRRPLTKHNFYSRRRADRSGTRDDVVVAATSDLVFVVRAVCDHTSLRSTVRDHLMRGAAPYRAASRQTGAIQIVRLSSRHWPARSDIGARRRPDVCHPRRSVAACRARATGTSAQGQGQAPCPDWHDPPPSQATTHHCASQALGQAFVCSASSWRRERRSTADSKTLRSWVSVLTIVSV